MTEPADIPDDVLRFLVDRIDTVPHLEALLLLWEGSGRPWTEAEIATRVYVDAETSRSLLQDLVRQRLVAAEEGPPTRYVYDPAWDETGELMPRLASTYARHLVRVAQLIHSKASPGVREFARAFQLKKD
jgi:hypothetical protein